jgi:hypothetical protein
MIRLSQTKRANAFLRGLAYAGFTREAMQPIIERANVIARGRNAKTVGRGAIEQALAELSKERHAQ